TLEPRRGEGGRVDVRHALRNNRAAALRRRARGGGERNGRLGRPSAAYWLGRPPWRGPDRRPAFARRLPDGRRSRARTRGPPHVEGDRLPPVRSRGRRRGALGGDQG